MAKRRKLLQGISVVFIVMVMMGCLLFVVASEGRDRGVWNLASGSNVRASGSNLMMNPTLGTASPSNVELQLKSVIVVDEDGENIVGQNDVDITKGIKVTYNFEIPAETKAGDFSTFKVPDEILLIWSQGEDDFYSIEIYATEEEEIEENLLFTATFDTESKIIKLVFGQGVTDSGAIEDAYLWYWAKVNSEKINNGNGGQTTIWFEGYGQTGEGVTIDFETKKVDLQKSAQGGIYQTSAGTFIEWVIDVNSNGANIENITIVDEIEDGLEYVEGSAEEKLVSGWTVIYEEATTTLKWTYAGSTNEKHKLSYITKVVDIHEFEYDNKNEEYVISNKAQMTGKYVGDDSFDIEAKAECRISPVWIFKDGEYSKNDDRTITFWITVNQDFQKMPNPLRLEDVLGDYLTLDRDTIKVYEWPHGKGQEDAEELTEGIHYTLGVSEYLDELTKEMDTDDLNQKTFSIVWNEVERTDEHMRYLIKYTAKIEDAYFEKNRDTDEAPENTAYIWFGSGHKYGGPVPVGVDSFVIKKTAVTTTSSFDYSENDKTGRIIEWKITINSNKNKYPSDYPVILTDKFATDTMEFVKDSIVYEYEDKSLSSPDKASFNVSEVEDGAFTITFMSEIINEKTLNIYYKTRVSKEALLPPAGNQNGNHSRSFRNEAELSVNGDFVGKDDATVSIHRKILSKQVSSYDNRDGSIDWKITVNEIGLLIGTAELEDILPKGIEPVKGEDGRYQVFWETENQLIPENDYELKWDSSLERYVFRYQFANLDKAYYFIIKTKLTEDEFANYAGEYSEKYTNKVFLRFGGKEYTAEAAHELKSKPVEKGGKANSKNQTIDWTVTVNAGVFDWKGQVTIEDTLQSGLVLQMESVKLYRKEKTYKGAATGSESIVYEYKEGDEHLEYDLKTNTFIFHFPAECTSKYVYILKFTTDVLYEGTYKNTILLKGTEDESGSDDEIIKDFRWGAGGGGSITDGLTYLTIRKYGSDGLNDTLLSNVKFAIWKDGEEKNKKETDSNGLILFDEIKLNTTYYLQEVEAPDGYRIRDGKWSITGPASLERISEGLYKLQVASSHGGNSIQIQVENERIKGDIVIIKKGDDGEKLPEVEFTLRKKDTNEIIDTDKTNSQGKIVFKDIDFGEYLIEETKMPDGYIKGTDDTWSVNIDGSGSENQYEYEIINYRIKGNVQIEKKDESNQPLAGAVFVLADANNKEKIIYESLPTDEEGKTSFVNVDYGAYLLYEKEAPTGYIISDKEYPVKIEAMNQALSYTFENTLARANVEIIKVSSSNHNTYLKGAKFRLYEAATEAAGNTVAGAFIDEYETNENGRIHFPDLEYGTYVLVEIQAPSGYRLPTNPQTIFSVEEKDHNQTIEIVITNQRRNTGGGGEETPTTAAPQPSTKETTTSEETTTMPTTTRGDGDQNPGTELPPGYTFEYDEETGLFMVIDPNGIPLGWFDSMEDIISAIPKTGDRAPVVILVILVIGAGGAIISLLSKKRFDD